MSNRKRQLRKAVPYPGIGLTPILRPVHAVGFVLYVKTPAGALMMMGPRKNVAKLVRDWNRLFGRYRKT